MEKIEAIVKHEQTTAQKKKRQPKHTTNCICSSAHTKTKIPEKKKEFY